MTSQRALVGRISLAGVLLLVLVACGPAYYVTNTPAMPGPSTLARIVPSPTAIVSNSTAIPTVNQEMPTPSARGTSVTPVLRFIALNTPVAASYILTQGREVYVFESDRMQRVAVRLVDEAGEVPQNLYAQIYDSNGHLLPPVMANIGTPLIRREWDLPAPGTYHVQIYGSETDPRSLRLTVITLPMPEAGGRVMRYGETHSGMIRVRGQRDTWTFVGEEGDVALVKMVAPRSDSVVELYDPFGTILRLADDIAVGRDVMIEVTLPEDGVYTIVARMYGDDQTGGYQISLEKKR